MRRVRYLALMLMLVGFADVAQALAPDVSLRPVPRPVSGQAAEAVQASPPAATVGLRLIARTVPGVVRSLRPPPRPRFVVRGEGSIETPVPDRVSAARTVRISANTPGVVRSLRPVPRPRFIRRTVADATPTRAEGREERRRRRSQTRSGSVCGDRSLRGEQVARISGNLSGCGIANPVRITEVDGVRLSQASVMTCDTAEALKRWVNHGVRPAVGRLGGGVAGLRVMAHYSCRTRNNQRGARVSEHGKGRAIDIGAIMLKNGATIDVQSGWHDRAQGRILRNMHRAACGPFGTVLGPDADRHHQDHFHLDTAQYRSGSYCR